MSTPVLLAAVVIGCSGALAGADAILAYGSQEPGPGMPVEEPGVGAYLTYGPEGIEPGGGDGVLDRRNRNWFRRRFHRSVL